MIDERFTKYEKMIEMLEEAEATKQTRRRMPRQKTRTQFGDVGKT